MRMRLLRPAMAALLAVAACHPAVAEPASPTLAPADA